MGDYSVLIFLGGLAVYVAIALLLNKINAIRSPRRRKRIVDELYNEDQ